MLDERRRARFPRTAKLLKADEFSSAFRLRPWGRSAHFVLYGCRTDKPARVGIVVARKVAPRAVSRNLIKRLVREIFRHQRAQLFGWDILLRVHRRLDTRLFHSAASITLKKMCRQEIEGFFTGPIPKKIHTQTSASRPASSEPFI